MVSLAYLKVGGTTTLTKMIKERFSMQSEETKRRGSQDEEEVQDAMSTLIFAIAKHFIGDLSKLRDQTFEILANLRCKKLQDFIWYKDVFLTKVMTRDDCNQPFWKEKFIAGLPNVSAEKIKTKSRSQYNNKIPYDKLTHGDMVNIINNEGLALCNDLPLRQQIKREQISTKKELGNFCEQFGYSPLKRKTKRKEITKGHSYCKACARKPRTAPNRPIDVFL